MITANAEALEAKYAGKSQPRPPGEPPPLYAPGMQIPPDRQGQIPTGQPVPEGVIIEQRVGRAEAPSMAVVPPQASQGPQPAMQVVPPTGTGRTSIGTFVESKTNPMTTAPPPINSGIVAPPVAEVKPQKPRRKIDLTQMILDHMHELGGHTGEACQNFYEKSEASIKRYMSDPGSVPLSCVLKFLAKRPGVMAEITEELEPHFAANGNSQQSLPTRGKMDCMVLSPILERPTLPYHWVTLYLAKKYELGFDVVADTVIYRSRNMLAQRFLASGATWSLWLDGDMAAPIANKDWYQWITGGTTVPDEYAGYDVLSRLMSHGKGMVGGVYASRRFNGQLVVQPEIRPRSHEDKQLAGEIRRGTARGLKEVDWIGFGCALVHRGVFLEVQQRFPELAPQAEFLPWRYFQPVGDEGEDEAFCQRVKRCDIPIWLDTQLVCGHIGNMCFMPEHTVPPFFR